MKSPSKALRLGFSVVLVVGAACKASDPGIQQGPSTVKPTGEAQETGDQTHQASGDGTAKKGLWDGRRSQGNAIYDVVPQR